MAAENQAMSRSADSVSLAVSVYFSCKTRPLLWIKCDNILQKLQYHNLSSGSISLCSYFAIWQSYWCGSIESEIFSKCLVHAVIQSDTVSNLPQTVKLGISVKKFLRCRWTKDRNNYDLAYYEPALFFQPLVTQISFFMNHNVAVYVISSFSHSYLNLGQNINKVLVYFCFFHFMSIFYKP